MNAPNGRCTTHRFRQLLMRVSSQSCARTCYDVLRCYVLRCYALRCYALRLHPSITLSAHLFPVRTSRAVLRIPVHDMTGWLAGWIG